MLFEVRGALFRGFKDLVVMHSICRSLLALYIKNGTQEILRNAICRLRGFGVAAGAFESRAFGGFQGRGLPQTLNLEPSTLNPKASTLSPKL